MADNNNIFNYGASLVSGQNKVQSPFIIVKIGKYTFGHCQKKEQKTRFQSTYKITYPNYMDSLNVTKVNGTVNVYRLTMTYAVTNTDDPNMLDKVFSSISKSREITLTYGDWELPTYIYKEEKALITKVTTRINLEQARISYEINCTSTALSLQSGVYNFPAFKDKPSNVIKNILFNKSYGLTDLFKGMINKSVVLSKGLIASDDKVVSIPAKNSTNILDYISFLVSYMTCVSDSSDSNLKSNVYYWYICDDTNFELGGNYFKVVRVNARTATPSAYYNAYEIDIGYPSANNIMNFSVTQDDSWAILYDYSQNIKMPEYSYTINNKGELEQYYSPTVSNSGKYFITTEADKTWWTKMTQFPIQATLTIQGLLRPSTLMSYVKVNVYFYSHKHVSSGLYIITKQVDDIGDSGYKTTLSLTRIGADSDSKVG